MTATGAPDLPGLRFLEPLGTGGFSEVYLYERDQPRIKVAVKLMKADVLNDAQLRQFAAEADTMAELAEHPFIVPVLGAGTAPDGRPYLVMRYYPPPDLGERVATAPMSVPDALRTGIQLASAIETAHRSGIIHRDIKPGNVLVSSYGVPGLSDFGIAGRAADVHEDDDHLGVSVPWSPPEILTGVSNGSAATDIYSLAATIWNLLVGRSPFSIKGDDSERAMFTRILHSRPTATGRADVPGSLDRLLQQAMAKDPDHRPRTAIEFARHLQRIEQELRLARTEIVVLDTRPESRSGDPDSTMVASFAPPAPAEPSPAPAETSRRADLPAAPLPPAPPGRPSAGTSSAGATQRRPRTVRASVSNMPDDDATRVRPAVVVPTDSTNASVRDRTSGPQPGEEAGSTVRRPATVSPTHRAATEPSSATDATDIDHADGHRSRTVLGLVLALVLLVAVVAGGALIGRGGSEQGANTDLPNDSGPTGAGDAVGVSKPAAPEVRARVRGAEVIFTWDRVSADDRYVYSYNGRVQSAERPRVAIAHRGSEVCIRVSVVRASVQGDGTLTCGRP